MNKPTSITLPVIYHNDEMWIVLNALSSRGLIRAAYISKSRHIHDFDGHHCEEVAVKTSIRYKPRWFESIV